MQTLLFIEETTTHSPMNSPCIVWVLLQVLTAKEDLSLKVHNMFVLDKME